VTLANRPPADPRRRKRCSAGRTRGLVEIDGFRLEAPLDGILLIYSNLDVPGVIGQIGMLLGHNGVNIAGCSWAANNGAVVPWQSVNVDDSVPGPVLDEIVASRTSSTPSWPGCSRRGAGSPFGPVLCFWLARGHLTLGMHH